MKYLKQASARPMDETKERAERVSAIIRDIRETGR